tara:strand:+ start:5538 stop:9491 length:3954 start_codon:yes stop_codon:yes gene_type:complete
MARQHTSGLSNALAAEIDRCMVRDRFALRKLIQSPRGSSSRGGSRNRGKQRRDDASGRDKRLASRIERSQAHVLARREAVPAVTYPGQLPISARVTELREALEKHQVVIVAGETGSGKTTQLPKICLEAGRGVFGTIGHTQPRRVAARTVGARIAEELGVTFGEEVGYQVRFTDKTSPKTLVKVMTDGILLAETQNDRFLEQYDTLIIDEAHERSLNIDFLLGYLKRVLPKRPDLKVIVTSATIDLERFSRHFGNAPVVQVSGRTYPVDVLYRPLEDDTKTADSDELVQRAIVDAVNEVLQLETGRKRPVGILVFLPGEREIRETAQLLRKAGITGLEVLPLYSRLSNAEQNKVFNEFHGRRVVLATNVAETSLTVPGIRYVIDPGTARVSRYSIRSKVQQLPVERVSQASAEQRKGRCGRLSEGICIRLYSEEDFEAREAFTQPEILRTNLAAVILQMLMLRLGDISDFPFVEKPDQRQVNDGFHLLFELGAVDHQRNVTRLGRDLARFPVDLRFARMLVEAAQKGALAEVLVITSALSIADPRERPHEARDAADEKHARFDDERSDFVAFLNLWRHYEGQRQELTQGKLRKLCRDEFLAFMRMREWRDVHRELTVLCREMKLHMNDAPASYEAIHQSLLSGLLGFIGSRDGEHEYLGARNRRHYIFPGSSLFRKRPRWIVSSQLTQTSRLFGRVVGSIDKKWIEPLARHLVHRSYSDVTFEGSQGEVMATEEVSLYNLPIVTNRRVNYGAVEPLEARALFIQQGLVEGQLRSRAPFYRHNTRLLAEIDALESKVRKRDIRVRNDVLFDFYDRRLPHHICGRSDLDLWRKEMERESPKMLHLSSDLLMARDVSLPAAEFPEAMIVDDMRLKLDYHFDPLHADDGVSVNVPVAVIRQIPEARLDWLIPGLLQEKCLALIRSLPKSVRKNFVPAQDYVERAVKGLEYEGRPLAETFARRLFRLTGVRVDPADFKEETLANHLRMNIRVVGADGKVLGAGRDIAALRRTFAEDAKRDLDAGHKHPLERSNLVDWDFDELPEHVEVRRGGLSVRAYPALVDKGDSVSIALHDSPAAARSHMTAGLVRLLRLRLSEQARYAAKNVPGFKRFALFYATIGSADELLDDIVGAAFRYTFCDERPFVRTRQEFEARVAARGALFETLNRVGRLIGDALEQAHAIRKQLESQAAARFPDARADLQEQLMTLLGPGFMRHTPERWLAQLPRYLKAAAHRLEKLPETASRDGDHMALVQKLTERLEGLSGPVRSNPEVEPEVLQYRWMLEELRVSLFAQQLGTSVPVSGKRLDRQWDKVRMGNGISA